MAEKKGMNKEKTMEKTCKHCKKQFIPGKWHDNLCADCLGEYKLAWRIKNREKIRLRSREIRRLKRQNIPRIKKVANPNSYTAVHRWLKDNHENKQICEMPECEGKSNQYEWSKKIGCAYEKKRENFWRLCKKCHARYDAPEKNIKNLETCSQPNYPKKRRVQNKNCGICNKVFKPYTNRDTNRARYKYCSPICGEQGRRNYYKHLAELVAQRKEVLKRVKLKEVEGLDKAKSIISGLIKK